ncbi:MAG: hypothetical protein D6757_00160 [Alphaproteobacteria bacterium]|nr:MAG: hypothetical protein D6757_00160 [Alphaproteobacteria bacterium]
MPVILLSDPLIIMMKETDRAGRDMIDEMDREGLARVAQSLMAWEPGEEQAAARRVGECLGAYYLPFHPRIGEDGRACRPSPSGFRGIRAPVR